MKRRGLLIGAGSAIVLAVLAILTSRGTVDILAPAGTIASHERSLIYFAAILSVIVVVPVFGLTAWIVWRYREGNTKAVYDPKWDHNRIIEGIWWLIPTILIAILATVAWRSSHTLDPTVAIASNQPALRVQVVALQWKWLFIYPDQDIALVNKLMLPVGRPVHFDITADAPMNSFWIPQLGGQIYAMPGMSTQLSLEADRAGSYRGSSANISGTGFSDMNFQAVAIAPADFTHWSTGLQRNKPVLSSAAYELLRRPAPAQISSYGAVQPNLYRAILERFMDSHDHAEAAS